MWIPAVSIIGTIGAYMAARALTSRSRIPLVNPFIIGTALVLIGLSLTGLSYDRYREGVQPLAFLLGPATVALGVPLCRSLPLLQRNIRPLLIGGGLGALTGAAAVTLAGVTMGMGRLLLLALIPKSVTTPVAIGITQVMGGEPNLTAAMTTLTGFTGILFAQPLLNLLRIRSPIARGMALGVSLHGMGTVAALEESELTAAIAGLGMTIAAVATALAAPWLMHFVPG